MGLVSLANYSPDEVEVMFGTVFVCGCPFVVTQYDSEPSTMSPGGEDVPTDVWQGAILTEWRGLQNTWFIRRCGGFFLNAEEQDVALHAVEALRKLMRMEVDEVTYAVCEHLAQGLLKNVVVQARRRFQTEQGRQ
jgi:hypothetical protein